MQSLITMSRNILYNTLLPVASNERENIAKKFLKFDLRPKSSGLLPHHSSKIFELLLLFFFLDDLLKIDGGCLLHILLPRFKISF